MVPLTMTRPQMQIEVISAPGKPPPPSVRIRPPPDSREQDQPQIDSALQRDRLLLGSALLLRGADEYA
jgi:hypothetical protein